MNCKDKLPSLMEMSDHQAIIQLSKERNKLAKSRQQWIQAAFNLAHHEDYTLFNKLVEKELCDECVKIYSVN